MPGVPTASVTTLANDLFSMISPLKIISLSFFSSVLRLSNSFLRFILLILSSFVWSGVKIKIKIKKPYLTSLIM